MLYEVITALARLFGEPADPGVRIDMKLSAQDLGDLIGASGENVARQLALWTEQGVIAQAGAQLTLLRPEMLEELAVLATL